MGDPNDSGGGNPPGSDSDKCAPNTGTPCSMDVDVSGERLINNGLLCSILQALSTSVNADDLIANRERLL